MSQGLCFAYRWNHCSVLYTKATKTCCIGYENCPFYKDHAQYNADLDQHYQRLRQLPLEEQRAIADQYYHGRMPWAMSVTPAWPEKPLRF